MKLRVLAAFVAAIGLAAATALWVGDGGSPFGEPSAGVPRAAPPSASSPRAAGPSRGATVRAAADGSATPISGPTPLGGCPGLPGTVDDYEAEPHLAVNPRDPNNLIAAWQQDRSYGARGDVAAWSSDGGETWHTVRVPGADTCTTGILAVADPWITFDRDGTAYIANLPGSAGANTNPGVIAKQPYRLEEVRSTITVDRSTDGGRTWSAPSDVVDKAAFNDKPLITADPRRSGTVYATWERSGGDDCQSEDQCTPVVFFARSDDAARTWSPPLRIAPPDPKLAQHNSRIFVSRDGSLRLFYELGDFREKRRLMVTSSSDGGRSFSDSKLVLTQDNVLPTSAGQRQFYAIFEEALAASDDGSLVLAHVRATGADTHAPSKVLLQRSENGTDWGEPITVADLPVASMLPTVAASADGRIAVSWYDFADDKTGDGQLTTSYHVATAPGVEGPWRKTTLGRFDAEKCGDFAPPALPGPKLPWIGEYFGLAPKGDDAFATVFVGCGELSRRGPEDILYAAVPASRSVGCASRRRLTIRLREPLGRADRLKSARVTVDGKRVRVRRRGRRLVATVDLRTVKARRTVVVKIRSRTRRGKTINEVRRYRTCTRSKNA